MIPNSLCDFQGTLRVFLYFFHQKLQRKWLLTAPTPKFSICKFIFEWKGWLRIWGWGGLPRWRCAVLWVVAQFCPTLCNLVDCSPPGSSVHGILQARILEWVALPFEPACQCRRHKIHGFDPWVGKIPCRRAGQLTPVFLVALFATPWTVAHQATGPLPMAFPLPFPSPGDLPNPGMELGSPALQADSLSTQPSGKPRNVRIPAYNLCLKD